MPKPYPSHPPSIAGREFVPISCEAVGITANNPGFEHVASARSIMNGSHSSQAIVVAGIEEPITTTGIIREIGKYAFDVSMPHDGVIERVIRRYNDSSFPFSPGGLVIYRREHDGKFDCFHLKQHSDTHKKFTFRYENTPEAQRLYPRSVIRKGTQFAKASCIGPNHGASLSLNLMTAYMSDDRVAEDCIWISESAAKRMQFKMRTEHDFGCGTRSFPINTYGDSTRYLVMPELGDYVRPDSLLFASRRYDVSMAPISMSREGVTVVDANFDDPYYAPLNAGRVVDIEVWRNHSVPPTLPSAMREQLDRYHQALRRYHTEVLDLYHQLSETHRRTSGYHDRTLPISPEFCVEVYTAMRFLDRYLPIDGRQHVVPDNMRNPLRLERSKVPLDEYSIKIVLEYDVIPKRGVKLAGDAGDRPLGLSGYVVTCN